jgi:hypothetical protein
MSDQTTALEQRETLIHAAMIRAGAKAARRTPCMGVCCGRHARCQRYTEIDGSDPSPNRIATCTDGRDYPLFIAAPIVAKPAERLGALIDESGDTEGGSHD